jgi:hypothetical protein
MFKKILVSLIIASGCSSAFASSECSGKIASINAAEDGSVWIALDRAPSAVILPSNRGFKSIVASVLTSYSGDRNVVIRFLADGVSCNPAQAYRNDVTSFGATR